jgi:hypothetical protein
MKCECPSCTDNPATTHTEQHRLECEARTVMGWTKEKRQAFYAGVKKNRGDNAVKELIGEVKRQHVIRATIP